MAEIKNNPKTLEALFVERFLEMEEFCDDASRACNKERLQNNKLRAIIDTLKKHATVENGHLWIHIFNISDKADYKYIVKELGLKEKKEEKSNE